MLRGKSIAVNANNSTEKKDLKLITSPSALRHWKNNSSLNLNQVEGIIKIRAQISKMENRKQWRKSIKAKMGSSKR